jgi:hypothetical protein
MPLMTFDKSKWTSHPQAKRLGLEMLEAFFNNQLSELGLSMLKKGVDELGIDVFFEINRGRKRAPACLLPTL